MKLLIVAYICGFLTIPALCLLFLCYDELEKKGWIPSLRIKYDQRIKPRGKGDIWVLGSPKRLYLQKTEDGCVMHKTNEVTYKFTGLFWGKCAFGVYKRV